MTYTFKLSRRLSVMWRKTGWLLILGISSAIVALPWHTSLSTLSLFWLVAKVIGPIGVERYSLPASDRRQSRAASAFKRRKSDLHHSWQIFGPTGRFIWQVTLLGVVKVVG